MAKEIVNVPTKKELREQWLSDVRLAAIETGITDDPPTAPGSEWYLAAESNSNLALHAISNTQITANAANLLTAVGDDLEDIRISEGLPEVLSSKSTGKIVPQILGSTTILNGTQFIYPNGLRGKVISTYINPSNGAEIDAESVNTGSATRLEGGETVRFVNAPVNVGIEAKVSTSEPLSGGLDAEDDERKRQRILNVRRNRPAGGNWGYIRQLILDNMGGVQDVYVYPAPGGPGSAVIVPIRDFDLTTRDYSRACSSATLLRVRQLVWSNVPISDENVIRAVADQNTDATIKVTIPDAASSGGNGLGWTDGTVWPPLVGGDSNVVSISAVNATGTQITVTAQTTTSPIAGQTNVAWWCIPDRKFYTALVVAVSGSSGAWVLTLSSPFNGPRGELPASGDYVCPASQGLASYGAKWIGLFRAFGPGEITSDVGRLPRSKRHPYVTDEDPSGINYVTLGNFRNGFNEITSIDFGVVSATVPTVPADVDTAPNVLIPRKFAVYKA